MNGIDFQVTKMRQRYRSILFTLLSLLFYIGCLCSKADGEHTGTVESNGRPVLSLGYMIKNLMMGDVPEEDALTAMEMWSKELANEINFRSVNHVYDDLDSLVNAFKQKKIDMAGGSALEYIKIRNEIESEPGIGFVKNGRKDVVYLLLVQHDSGIERLEDLEGKTLTTVKNSDNAMLFLDTIFLRNKGKEADHYFGKITSKSHFSKAILSVFFKESDAGVATDTALEIMSELNPQIGKRVKIIESSPPLIDRISFFHKDFEHKEAIKKKSVRIQKKAKGRQFLTLFKIDSLAPIDESDLKPLEALYNEYKSLINDKRLKGGSK